MNEQQPESEKDANQRQAMNDDVKVPLDLLLSVIGMTDCEREWQHDSPRRMQGTGMPPYVHKADCRPCALHALAVAQRGQEAS